MELLRCSKGFCLSLHWTSLQVSLPLLILHGEADIVTDPSVSKALYDKASSLDKKLNLYKDAYHSLLEGEPDEMIIRVFNNIVSWLDEHSAKCTGSWLLSRSFCMHGCVQKTRSLESLQLRIQIIKCVTFASHIFFYCFLIYNHFSEK